MQGLTSRSCSGANTDSLCCSVLQNKGQGRATEAFQAPGSLIHRHLVSRLLLTLRCIPLLLYRKSTPLDLSCLGWTKTKIKSAAAQEEAFSVRGYYRGYLMRERSGELPSPLSVPVMGLDGCVRTCFSCFS